MVCQIDFDSGFIELSRPLRNILYEEDRPAINLYRCGGGLWRTDFLGWPTSSGSSKQLG